MSASSGSYVLGYVGVFLFVVGAVVAATLILRDPESRVRVRWSAYVDELDRLTRFLMLERSGQSIARAQLAVLVGIPIFAFVFDDVFYLVFIPVVAVLPLVLLRGRASERSQQIEAQLDSWLLMLANALKATPSLGEAINNSARLMRPPLSEELDLALKENQLGTPLDQAVLNMSARVGSPAFSSALATILVGRQTGGDLPKIMEESAATLREMARLEGVVRTKTAEGKSQAYVLGGIPFLLIGAIHFVDENWLAPLGQSSLGFIIMAVAAVLWVGAIFLARRILAVDI